MSSRYQILAGFQHLVPYIDCKRTGVVVRAYHHLAVWIRCLQVAAFDHANGSSSWHYAISRVICCL